MATERGTKERWQHDKPQVRSIEMGSGKATTEVIAVHNPHVIDMLADAGVLTQQQADAALWLAELRQAAGLDGRVVSSYNPLGAGGEQSDEQAERQAKFNTAVKRAERGATAVLLLLEGYYSPNDLDALYHGLNGVSRYIAGK